MSDQASRRREYEHALRWYPADWRRVHGPAMVGDLMDQDDDRGRDRPTRADRVSFFTHGLRMRSLRRVTPAAPALALRAIALLGCGFFAVFYWTTSPTDLVGALPPGSGVIAADEPKTFLGNGTVVPLLLLALGATAALARRDVLARVLGGAAALAALVVTRLAVGTWNGPDAPVGTALVLFGVMAAVPGRRWTSVPGFAALVAAVLLLELWLAFSTPALLIASCLCLLVAAAIGADALRRRLQRRTGSTDPAS